MRKEIKTLEETVHTIKYSNVKMKVYHPASNWLKYAIGINCKMKFKEGYILTYSLPQFEGCSSNDFVYRFFNNSKERKLHVCASVGRKPKKNELQFWDLMEFQEKIDEKKMENIERWAGEFPNIKFYVSISSHVKLYAFDNGNVIWGSSNFPGGSIEFITEIKSKKFYKDMEEKVIQPILKSSKRIEIKNLNDFM